MSPERGDRSQAAPPNRGRGASDRPAHLGHRLPQHHLAPDVRQAFGVSGDDVHLRDRPPSGLSGAALGNTVALADEARGSSLEARAIAAHELAHVVDQSSGSGHEERADRIAVRALMGRPVARVDAERARGPLVLRGCPRKTSAADRARAALDQFAKMSAADQELFVAANYRPGSYGGVIRVHLEALPAEERVGKYRDTIRRVMQLVERQEVRASTGLSDLQMAQRQATFMDAQALADAQAATGSATPTPAQQQQAHRESVAQLGLGTRTTNRWAALPPPPDPAQANFRNRAAAAVQKIVARALVVAPELKISPAHLHFAPEKIDGATDTRYAEYDRAHHRLNFGMDFTDAAMSNPDYVLGTVVHEVFGHAEHGGIGESYALSLYTAARPLTTTALTPAERGAAPSRSERFGFGYQDTEIYSELRESQYDVRAPSGAGVVQSDEARRDVRNRVGLIKDKWDPTIARGLIRGMYARFALDPRITPAALQLFIDAVNHHFPGENLLAPRP